MGNGKNYCPHDDLCSSVGKVKGCLLRKVMRSKIGMNVSGNQPGDRRRDRCWENYLAGQPSVARSPVARYFLESEGKIYENMEVIYFWSTNR